MNNFLDMTFFGTNQMAIVTIAGAFIGAMLLAGGLLWIGLDIWDKSGKRREK